MFVGSGFQRGGLKVRSTRPSGFGRVRGRAGVRTRARRAARREARVGPGVVPVFVRAPGELKFHDLDIDDATIASNGTIAQVSCNLIAQGVTEVQRIGRKCILRSVNWRFIRQIIKALIVIRLKDIRNSCSRTIGLFIQIQHHTHRIRSCTRTSNLRQANIKSPIN